MEVHLGMGKLEVVPFGKYKGQPMEAMAQDHEYCEWLSQQDWFRARYPTIHTLIVNNFGQPEETPEHNALQALFVDEGFRVRFMVHVLGEKRIREILLSERRSHITAKEEGIAECEKHIAACDREIQEQPDDYEIRYQKHLAFLTASQYCRYDPERDSKKATIARWQEDHIRRIECARKAKSEYQEKKCGMENALRVLKESSLPTLRTTVEFEVGGSDVQIECRGAHELYVSRFWERADIECKPSVGDDYPAILRQMKSDGSHILFIGQGGYRGTGATFQQVNAIFKSSNIRIVLQQEITSLDEDIEEEEEPTH